MIAFTKSLLSDNYEKFKTNKAVFFSHDKMLKHELYI